MDINASDAKLQDIPIDKIDRNKENPRLLFRPREMEELLESIRVYGVQVPISVYREGGRYTLIDGERRWLCCKKLNKRTIPALIQREPDPLTNLLLMFNIHALREQWDLITIAMKLPRIVELLTRELKKEPTERELAEKTGLKQGVIRRCKLLLGLPKQYRQQILAELNKPKAQQKVTEDLFIEMERALKTVERALPQLIDDKDRVRHVLLEKYKSGIIDNRVHFRNVAKIARAENVGADINKASRVLLKLFEKNNYSIERAYSDSVSEAYSEREVSTRANSLIQMLEGIDIDEIEDDAKAALLALYARLRELLEQ